MSGKRIFMTGASGYIGSRITTFAIEEGYTVCGLARSDATAEKTKALGATPVRGDVSSLDVLTREAAAADIVIHLADTLLDNIGSSYDIVLDADRKAIDAFVAGIKGTGKPLITSSGSLAAAPDPEGKETDENSPLMTNTPIKRYVSEQYALSQADKGIRVCAIRLSGFVYGRGGSGMRMFMERFAAAGEALYFNSNPNGEMANIHVDDAARMYLAAIKYAKPGEAYNCTNPTYVRQKDWVEAMATTLKLPVKAVEMEEVQSKVGFLGLFLGAKNRATSAKARKELDWEAKEIGLVDDLLMGSYVEVAAELKAK
ncbi:NAD dependent epimerase/dehydratase [Lophiotrema nucula]|uniref:NAD dependent epimerase/dehydratase n=1 Tax=Lophiotrema nucula TaxID=690887 RepID=A0A6A5ZUR8_9PLEO|nr:NAD dependent epimerase/dehydratase [Lophiotrema nucula]